MPKTRIWTRRLRHRIVKHEQTQNATDEIFRNQINFFIAARQNAARFENECKCKKQFVNLLVFVHRPPPPGDIENCGSSIASIWCVRPNVLSGVVAAIKKMDWKRCWAAMDLRKCRSCFPADMKNTDSWRMNFVVGNTRLFSLFIIFHDTIYMETAEKCE